MYEEEDILQLSGIQHFVFCKRQWALAYIEMQWQENVRTVEGKLLHEKAHDPSIKEKRGDTLIVRAMPIHSRRLGVSGECDVVEFHRTKDGIPLFGMADRFVLTLINKKIMKESCFTKKENGAVCSGYVTGKISAWGFRSVSAVFLEVNG